MDSKSGRETKTLVAIRSRMDNLPCETFMYCIVSPSILKVDICVDNSLLLKQGANSNFYFDDTDYGFF